MKCEEENTINTAVVSELLYCSSYNEDHLQIQIGKFMYMIIGT